MCPRYELLPSPHRGKLRSRLLPLSQSGITSWKCKLRGRPRGFRVHLEPGHRGKIYAAGPWRKRGTELTCVYVCVIQSVNSLLAVHCKSNYARYNYYTRGAFYSGVIESFTVLQCVKSLHRKKLENNTLKWKLVSVTEKKRQLRLFISHLTFSQFW